MRGFMNCHAQIIVGSDVVTLVARPAQIEGLALDGAAGHFDKLGNHAHFLGIGKIRIPHNGTIHHGKRKVARVNGDAQAFGEVHAGHAATRSRLVGDIVVNKSRRMEVLDGRSGGCSMANIAAHSNARRKANQRAMTLTAVLAVFHKGPIEIRIHIGMIARRDIRVH